MKKSEFECTCNNCGYTWDASKTEHFNITFCDACGSTDIGGNYWGKSSNREKVYSGTLHGGFYWIKRHKTTKWEIAEFDSLFQNWYTFNNESIPFGDEFQYDEKPIRRKNTRINIKKR